MTDITPTDAARLLAGRRPRVQVVCAICGKPFRALQRRETAQNQARTCSDACRSKLSRRERKQAAEA